MGKGDRGGGGVRTSCFLHFFWLQTPFLDAWLRPCQGGGGFHVACQNFKMSCIYVLSIFHVAVRNASNFIRLNNFFSQDEGFVT